jgi:hypothetical protein
MSVKLLHRALVLAFVTLVTAAVALAANQEKGWTYSSPSAAHESVYFMVSTNGKKVVDLSASTPVKCPSSVGGVGGIASATGGSATISRHGTFKVTMKQTTFAGHKSAGTDTVTGTFLEHGQEKGKVTSHFNSNTGICKATTRSYTTTGTAPAG